MEESAQGAPKRPVAKRHLRNYLLDKRFQLYWVWRVTIATAIIVAVMGYLLYGTVSDASDQILAQKLGDLTLTEEAQEAFIKQNASDKLATIIQLAVGLFVLVLMLAIVTIVMTHRIAGPVFKMKKLFATIDGQHLQLYAKLRRGDELQDIFKEFDEMLRRLREHRHVDIKDLEEARALIGDDAQAGRRIDEVLVRFRESIKMD